MLEYPKFLVKSIFPTKVWPHPVIGLQPERLYWYMDALWQRRDLSGAVVEIGCHRGGTAATAFSMLKRTGHLKRYVCIDTFSGFVTSQFDRDQEHGTPSASRRFFTDNSEGIVRRLLNHYGCEEIELIPGDIASIDEALLPEAISVCLLDVDLDVPTYDGLKRVYPRLAEGGMILVDDCPEKTTWAGARPAYRRFCDELDLPVRFEMGMGIVERPRGISSRRTRIDGISSGPETRPA